MKNLENLLINHVYGENHPEIALSYNNYGALFIAIGNLKKAEEFMQKSLTIRLKICGENFDDTANSFSNLSLLYHKMNRNQEARLFAFLGYRTFFNLHRSNHLMTKKLYDHFLSLNN